jgi:hypothetical protein
LGFLEQSASKHPTDRQTQTNGSGENNRFLKIETKQGCKLNIANEENKEMKCKSDELMVVSAVENLNVI